MRLTSIFPAALLLPLLAHAQLTTLATSTSTLTSTRTKTVTLSRARSTVTMDVSAHATGTPTTTCPHSTITPNGGGLSATGASSPAVTPGVHELGNGASARGGSAVAAAGLAGLLVVALM